MNKKEIATGTLHKMPSDLKTDLRSSVKLLNAWNDLTPLARNEWICWIISVKKIQTRKEQIIRACKEILSGKKRPCYWAGCSHRK